MKFREALVLLMLAVCAFVPTIFAADYSAEESVIERMLLDPEMNVPIKGTWERRIKVTIQPPSQNPIFLS